MPGGVPWLFCCVENVPGRTLFEDAVVYRNVKPDRYRLFQVADYICGIELAAIRYEHNQAGPTEERFLGLRKAFRQNYLKKLRRHRLD